MPVTLTNFESHVERKIVERGLDYYRSGDIKKLEKVSENEFSAVVYGTEKYSLYVKVKDKEIIEHECNCPYDFGDICKHKVAVFYSIRADNFIDTSDKLKLLLENLHESALRRFITTLLKKDRNFRTAFLREFDENFEESEDDEEFDEDYY